MDFPERLKQLRVESGFTQEELAKKLQQTKANISKYENGRIEPNIEVINRLAEIFNISIDYLLGKTEIRTPETQTIDDQLRALLSDPDMRVAFQDYESWTENEKKDLIEYIEFKRSKREKK